LRKQRFWNIGILAIVVLLIVGGTLSFVAYDEYQQAQESEYRLLEAHAAMQRRRSRKLLMISAIC